jgi:hypothetical protein
MRQLIPAVAILLSIAGCGDDGGASAATDSATTATAPGTTAPATTAGTATTSTAPASTSTSTAEDAALEIAITVAGDSIEVRVEGVSATGRVEVGVGGEVRLTVTADVDDEVHVHGYDVTAEVSPDSPATLEFVAEIPGIFEVELESSHRLLVELQVS